MESQKYIAMLFSPPFATVKYLAFFLEKYSKSYLRSDCGRGGGYKGHFLQALYVCMVVH